MNVTEALKVIASYAYIDQRVTQDTTLTGTRPTTVPRHSAAFWGDYTLQGGPLRNLGFGAGVRYMGNTEGSDDDSFQVPARVLVDTALHYNWQQWTLGLNVNNLFNREYISYCSNSFICYWGATRSVVGTARYQW